MKYLSTFTGIGGFELGINKAYEELSNNSRNENRSENNGGVSNDNSELPQGVRQFWSPICIGYSEINKYADQIYQSKFPEHKNYGDITKINEKELPDFDLFVGGFPCQAFSIAGKRGGFEDTRGTLFFDCARIINEKRPRHFILENVKGLLSHDNGNTFKTIITSLTDMGYCVEWQVLNAKNFGVPQNRERVFIVGHLGGIPKRKVFPIRETTSSTIKVSKRGKHQQDIVYSTDGIMCSLPAGTHGSSKHLTKIEQLNNPQHSNDSIYDKDGISVTLDTAQGGNRQPYITQLKIYDDYNSNWKKDDITCTLTTNTGSQAERNGQKLYDGSRIRRLTPLECERLMGYPDGWTEGLSDTQRYKTLGNGIVSNVVAEVVKKLYLWE